MCPCRLTYLYVSFIKLRLPWVTWDVHHMSLTRDMSTPSFASNETRLFPEEMTGLSVHLICFPVAYCKAWGARCKWHTTTPLLVTMATRCHLLRASSVFFHMEYIRMIQGRMRSCVFYIIFERLALISHWNAVHLGTIWKKRMPNCTDSVFKMYRSESREVWPGKSRMCHTTPLLFILNSIRNVWQTKGRPAQNQLLWTCGVTSRSFPAGLRGQDWSSRAPTGVR